MSLGRWGDAIDHIKKLLKKTPDDVDLMTKLGTCHFALDHNREAEQTLREAISQDPQQVAAYGLLASILRERLNNPEQADETIDKMVEMNPEDAKARLSRAVYIAHYFNRKKGRCYEARMATAQGRREEGTRVDSRGCQTRCSMPRPLHLKTKRSEEARRLPRACAAIDPENERIVQ